MAGSVLDCVQGSSTSLVGSDVESSIEGGGVQTWENLVPDVGDNVIDYIGLSPSHESSKCTWPFHTSWTYNGKPQGQGKKWSRETIRIQIFTGGGRFDGWEGWVMLYISGYVVVIRSSKFVFCSVLLGTEDIEVGLALLLIWPDSTIIMGAVKYQCSLDRQSLCGNSWTENLRYRLRDARLFPLKLLIGWSQINHGRWKETQTS